MKICSSLGVGLPGPARVPARRQTTFVLTRAAVLTLLVCAPAPKAAGQRLGGDYDAPIGGYCRGPGGVHQGVNGLSCPGVADMATCQRGCDLNKPRCVIVRR